VNLVESGALPREFFISGTYPFRRIYDAFAAIDDGSVVKALVTFGAS
jgi:Zn-dependent alcohol dehydrogenase